MLSADGIITTAEGLQLIEAADGTLVGQTQSAVFDLGGLSRNLIGPIVAACEEPTPFTEVVARSGLAAADVWAIVEGLWGLVFTAPSASADDLPGPVIIHGQGRLARTILEHLRRLGCDATADYSMPDTATYDRAVLVAPRPILHTATATAAVEGARAAVEDVRLRVIAHERLAIGAIADLLAQTPSLAVVPHAGTILVGGCPVCAVGQHRFRTDPKLWPLASLFRSAALSDSVGADVLAATAAREVIAVLRGAAYGDDLIVLSATGEREEIAAPHAQDCAWCGPLVDT